MRKDVVNLLERVIKRPAARRGRHALLVSLFPLLCATILLLFMSGCGVKPPLPDDADMPDASSVESQGSAPAPATKESEARAPLDDMRTAIYEVSEEFQGFVSTVLKELEQSGADTTKALEDILSNAETWLDKLIKQNEKSQAEYEANAPGLVKMSERLDIMLRVIRHNLTKSTEDLDTFEGPHAAIGKLTDWMKELKQRADTLPERLPSDSKSTSEPKVSDDVLGEINAKLEGMVADLGKLSNVPEDMKKISQSMESMSKESRSASLGFFGIAFFIVALVNFAFSIFLFFALKDFASQVDNSLKQLKKTNAPSADVSAARRDDAPPPNQTMSTAQSNSGLDDPYAQLDNFKAKSPTLSQNPQPSAPVPAPQKPEKQYFQVTNSVFMNGQSLVYLQKKDKRAEIWGTPADEDSQYYILPEMSNATDDGKRGTIETDVLYTGDVKTCFSLPKNRPTKPEARIAVIYPAVIAKTTGNQYQLTKPGKLSVE